MCNLVTWRRETDFKFLTLRTAWWCGVACHSSSCWSGHGEWDWRFFTERGSVASKFLLQSWRVADGFLLKLRKSNSGNFSVARTHFSCWKTELARCATGCVVCNGNCFLWLAVCFFLVKKLNREGVYLVELFETESFYFAGRWLV